ncbi:MAG: ATP-binding protein, partial [Myxococcota bacterium]|nr:ATP-binding protein [Myxococcota bacterium]
AAAHASPERQAILDELRRQFPAHPGSPQPAARVIASGQPELLPEVDARVLLEHTQNEEHRQLMQRLDVRSHLAVPLQLGDRTLGAISLGFVGTRRYSLADVALVEALASRAAVAIDNAHLYRAAEAARADAEAASLAKDEFLAMLGHELRNPLAPMVTALELTRARDGASRERTIIERQVDHLRRLVDDLLDVARITRGALELDRRALDLIEAVTDGVELARPIVDQRRHRLVVAVPPGLIVFGDRVRLAQVVANLVTNAARYSESGGDIWISATRVDREISLRVRDTGAGISAELLPRVFETFTRGSRAIDRAAGGLGIGLAIVKSLTTLHGGRAIARSEGQGQGSELEIVLPALDVSAPARQARTAAEPISAAPRLGLVLIVDDNVDAAELLGDVLAVHGFEVVTTYDPYEALALAKARRPSIALVDLGLPGMDGYALAAELRAEPTLADLVLVAVTGYGQRSDRERTTAAGFREHLVKPIKIDQLLPVLETLLTR